MEKWHKVPKTQGLYFVSNFGRVKSADRIVFRGKDSKPLKFKGKVLSPSTITGGYKQVILSFGSKGKRVEYVHRLVLAVFHGKSRNKKQVNHINGIKSDNRLENLEWCTPSENQKHCNSLGLRSRKYRRIKK